LIETSVEDTQGPSSNIETSHVSIEETRVLAVALRFKKLTSAGGIKPNYTGAEVDSNLIYMFDSQTVAIGVGKGWLTLIDSVSTHDVIWNRCLRITSVLYHVVNNQIILDGFRKYLIDEERLGETQLILRQWSDIHPQAFEQISAINHKLGIENVTRINGPDVELIEDENVIEDSQYEVSPSRDTLLEIDPVVNQMNVSVDLLD